MITIVSLLLVGGCDPEAPQRNAKLSRTHYLLGQDYVDKRNPTAAKQELLKALEIDPTNHEAHHLLGVIFFLEGVYAMNYIDRRQCLQGTAATEQRTAANEKFRQAEVHLKQAVALMKSERKTDSDALNYLANAALHFERYDEAVRYATRALDNIVYASRHIALSTRGWAHFKHGQLDKAASDLRQALFNQPNFCVARFRLAKVHYDKKDYERAAKELEKVTGDKTCAFQDPFHLLGLTYTKLHRGEEARRTFDRCVAINKNSCLSQECRRYAKLIGD